MTTADLLVHIRGPQDISAGSGFIISVVATNRGPDVARSAVLSVTFTPFSNIGSIIFCGCTGSGGAYTVALGDLPPNHPTEIQIEGLLSDSASGFVTLTAIVSAGDSSGAPVTDPDPTNNAETVSFPVVPPPADLFIGFGPTALGYYDSAIVSPNGAASLTVNVGNAGPTPASNATLAISAPWPVSSCAIPAGGTCEATAFGAQATFPSVPVGAAGKPSLSVRVTMTVPPSAGPGSEVTGTLYISSLNPDENPGDNSAAFNFRVQSSPSAALAVSTSHIDFGSVPFGFVSPARSVTVKNVSSAPVTLEAPFATSGFLVSTDTCFPGYVAPGDLRTMTLPAGASCTTDITANPYTRGVGSGQLVYTATNAVGQQAVALDDTSTSLLVSGTAIDFPLIPVGTTSTTMTFLYNVGPLPVHINSISLSGASFSQINDCPPDVPTSRPGLVAQACSITVVFSPTVAGPASGSLTIVDDDTVPRAVVQLNGRAASLTMTSEGSVPSVQSVGLDFDNHVLDIPVLKEVTLTNVSAVKANIPSIVASGDPDFTQKNNCPAALAPGRSCTIDAIFTPGTLGHRQGSIAIEDRATGVPQTVALAGDGTGIGARRHLYLHYDYMVLPDQGTMCTPGPADPGMKPTSPDCNEGQYCLDGVCRGHTHQPPAAALDAVVAAFARRGVELKIDPVSTAIPEVRFLEIDSQVVGCGATDSAYFYDLKTKYYKPSSPNKQEHYAIFGHFGYTPDFGCAFFSGESAGIPAYDFMVTLGGEVDLDPTGLEPDFAADSTGGTLMHEFGHNLGLEHPSPNFNPAQFSVMNYAYQFGIPEADHAGSTVVDPARTLIDYSSQVLPAAGNTPGTLTAIDLSEPAGLGSGDAKVMYFTDALDQNDIGPADGPVDWDGDGVADNPHAQDSWLFWKASDPRFPPITVGTGFDEWAYLFTGDGRAAPPGASPEGGPSEPEQSIDEAMARHVLMVPQRAQIVIQPGCTAAEIPIASGQRGGVRIALLGSNTFDVRQVDASSLAVHGSRPMSTALQDVNGDGLLDLLVTFDAAQMRLDRNAKKLRVSGWLTNSRLFAGEGSVVVVPSRPSQPGPCQQ